MEFKKKERGMVYFFKQKGVFPIKIGYSNGKDLLDRFKTFNTWSPYGAVFVGYIPSENPQKLEYSLHKKYKSYRLNGEWFNIDIEKIESELGFKKGSPDVVKNLKYSKCDERIKCFLQNLDIRHIKINRKEFKQTYCDTTGTKYITPQMFYKNVKLFCYESGIQCIERKVNGHLIFELIRI